MNVQLWIYMYKENFILLSFQFKKWHIKCVLCNYFRRITITVFIKCFSTMGEEQMKSVTVKAILCKLKFYSSVPKCANEYVKIDRMNIMETMLMV